MTLQIPAVAVFCSLLASALAVSAQAQELRCKVEVNLEAVSTSQKDLLNRFQADLDAYLNNYRWGEDALEEKIDCAFSVFVQSAGGENRYTAQVFVGSQRPVLGMLRATPLVRLKDDAWEFSYVNTTPLDHNLYQFNELTSFLDFYANLVIGYDYDTYEPAGGNPFFRKAADIVGLARSSNSKGWDFKPGAYSRAQLIDEILSPVFGPMRAAIYRFHFTGLDSLSSNPQRAMANILAALERIGGLRSKADARNLYMRFFFEAKHTQIAEVFRGYADPSVYLRLGDIDPVHRSIYEEEMNNPR